jgi:hypothetical protein
MIAYSYCLPLIAYRSLITVHYLLTFDLYLPSRAEDRSPFHLTRNFAIDIERTDAMLGAKPSPGRLTEIDKIDNARPEPF